MIRYEDFERERLDPIYDIIEPYSEMSKTESYFLNGMIRYLKPKKILEVGVSSGGGSALILNAISDIDGAELYSVDYSEKAYRHPDKPSGFLVEEKFSGLMDKWHIYRGGDVSRFIENIGGDIDFLVLDTVHLHPWETLNFLCVLPFMKKDFSWTVLHDINLSFESVQRFSSACRYLYASVVSEEKIMPFSDWKSGNFSNIGAFKVSEVTLKYIANLFESLFIAWDDRVSKNDLSDIDSIISRYYSDEQYKIFQSALKFYEHTEAHPVSFKAGIKIFLRHSTPKLFSSIRRLIRSIRGVS